MRQIKKIKCPICEKDVKFYDKEKLPPNFPFCSRRCKLVDLGKWLNEEYRIEGPVPDEQDLSDDES